ncbi:cobalt ECF transporter T component CbiQ [Phormidium sp. CLA17]|uniref:cobalt ECF transporter T component CbiQ n=1 Tax=Leptolyngbya sp. Cla-17 TaxID=2803751 RepID=UPI0014915672|nr:cobalt ECF transporter T component CbiQ [Leptolyngbya sp. Cla-17]MBM0741122.1 cobalt ECF transporter T component CbiQ [Leptolyngbya sp. Cla-17]
MLLHIGAFRLDVDSERRSPWHDLIPSTRVLCTVLMMFAIALTPNGHWKTWALYGLGIVRLAILSRVTFSSLAKRVGVEFSFIVVVLLGTLFQRGGEVMWQWGWLQITTVGLTTLGSVALKMLLSLTMINILILTTPIPALLHAIVTLRVPPLLVAIMASMYRYIAVLADEFQSMRRAALSRNLMNSRKAQRQVIGNMFGSLFIRTYDRGERVHQAMLARGYTGLVPLTEIPKGNWRDGVAITLVAAFAIAGQLFYIQGR